jgi:hypothetical protein
MRLSQQLGFKAFKVIKSFRAERAEARHWRTGEIFILEPADVYRSKWQKPTPDYVNPTDCMHLEQPGVYISADGKIGPCCYIADQNNFESTEVLLKQLDIATMLGTKPLTSCLKNCGSRRG